MSSPESYFSTRFVPHPRRDRAWAGICAYLQRWVATDAAVLDLGAGYGDFTRNIRAGRRVAFDVSPGLAGHVAPPIEVEVGSVVDLSRFDEATFDVVFASNLFEHLTWDELAVTVPQIRRVLRLAGILILVQPNFRLKPSRYFDDYTHRTVFSDRSLPDYLVSCGLEIEHVEARFLPLTMSSRLSFGSVLVPLYLRLPYRPLAGQMLVVARQPSASGGYPRSG